MNKEQLRKELDKALHKWENWDSFIVSKKGHGFQIEYVFEKPIKNAMSLEDVVIWKNKIQSKNEVEK